MYEFWDSQTTTSDLKSTHRPCGWLPVKSLDHAFLKTPYEWFMWHLTEFVLNTEDENGTKKTHIYDHFLVEVTPKNVKVTRGFHFWSKLNWKWNFYDVTCHHQASRRRLKPLLMCYICWGWTKIGFQSISDVKNDGFGPRSLCWLSVGSSIDYNPLVMGSIVREIAWELGSIVWRSGKYFELPIDDN